MKKVISVIIIFVIGINISACNTKHISYESSKSNFENYKQQIQEVIKKYNYTVEDYVSENSKYYDEEGQFKNLIIPMKVDGEIYISFVNYNIGTKKSKGIEDVTISYERKSDGRNFNLYIFVDVVNSVGGKKITMKECKKLINDNDFRRYIDPQGEIDFIKHKSLNFWEDWHIHYQIYTNTLTEKLVYYGQTKASTTIAYKVVWLSLIFILTCAGIIVTYSDIKRQKFLNGYFYPKRK